MSIMCKLYSAIDIAKYVINYAIDINRPISNLKLQKILYYIQGNFLSELGYPAFEEEIIAWKHGPVVPEVYFEFNSYSAYNITDKYVIDDKFTPEKCELEILNNVIKDKSNKDPWELVNDTHNETPWKEYYEQGKNIMIPKEKIKEFFESLKK
ncbi:Panacea domain-containing protein [Clostridium tyrobutyricum]|uniref:Panacea domain-containing protein n=1 Tax=Clostridium tyrobutyricum TaxID=1519 RepID=UPI000309AB29|nr:type II toxin-antitoxin system antitoxin SocA domain-containing protein [Clostridium tyrobutyricum]MEA5009950.1 DUF4065 domain-containing protein [Clostridium tyrobutyricum]